MEPVAHKDLIASVTSNSETIVMRPPAHNRVLLACYAHPDDESFGPSGATLAKYASQGVDVHLICATKGEVGEAAREYMDGHDSVADMRAAELTCAAKYLGLTAVHYLGYRDSGMPGSPDNNHPDALASEDPEQVAAQVRSIMSQLKPQVVITFDPAGGYHHPDHLAIHAATVDAFHAEAAPSSVRHCLCSHRPAKLYFSVFSKRLLRFTVRLMPFFGHNPRTFGRNGDIDLFRVAMEAFPIHARIDVRTATARKWRAAGCHRSQQDPPSTGLLHWVLRRPARGETFMRAFPPPLPGLREKDLFDGIS